MPLASMPRKLNTPIQWLRPNAIRLSRAHLALAAVYALIILASDAWNLVTRELTAQRWEMFGVLLIVFAITGFLARATNRGALYYRTLIVLLVLADIALATFVIYTERGMASRGVALYMLAIATATGLRSRSGLFAAATVAMAAYVLAATRYFYVYFNEGYKAELYTTLGMYGAAFLVLAAVLHITLGGREGE